MIRGSIRQKIIFWPHHRPATTDTEKHLETSSSRGPFLGLCCYCYTSPSCSFQIVTFGISLPDMSAGSNDRDRRTREREWEQALHNIQSPSAWRDFLFRNACMKQAYLMGAGVGSLVLAHKLRTYPRAAFNPAVNSAFFAFLFAFPVSFMVCAAESSRKQDLFQQAFNQSQKNKSKTTNEKNGLQTGQEKADS